MRPPIIKKTKTRSDVMYQMARLSSFIEGWVIPKASMKIAVR
jgi:hypothetical protein